MVMNGFDTNFDLSNEVYAVNTVGFHYVNEPIQVRRDELLRVYLVNVLEYDPLNSFHVHANFFQYYPTGTSLEPSEYTDTVIQGQGQRGILEMKFPFDGDYMFHAHVSEFAELGWTRLLPGRQPVAADRRRGVGRVLRPALGRLWEEGLMEAAAQAERAPGGLPAWLLGLIPLALIGAAIGAFALLGGPGLGERTGPPVEEVVVERTTLRPGEIELTLRNDGPDPVDLAQVAVNDAYAPFTASDGTEIGRLGSTTLTISYPWIEGEAYEIFILTASGGTVDASIPVAAETPEADLSFYGLMALLGIYVGVIPIALGLLWLPFVRRIDARWVGALIAFTVGLLALLGIDAALEGLDIAATAPGAFGGAALVFAGALVAYLLLAGVDAYLARRRANAGETAAQGGALHGAAGLDRDRPPQPRRGSGDRLRLRDRGARPRRLPRRRLRDPQHHGGSGDRRAAARWCRAERPRSLRPPRRPRPDRGRPGDPRRLDRSRRLQPQPGGAALRRRRRRDRQGDRPDLPGDAQRRRADPAPALGRRPARRDRPPLRNRPAGLGLMATGGTSPRRAPGTEAIEDYAKAIYAVSQQARRARSPTASWPSGSGWRPGPRPRC